MRQASTPATYADFMRRRFPTLWRSLRKLKYPLQALGKVEAVFTNIYDRNFWEAAESRSGPGSTLSETATLRAELPGLLRDLNVRALVDAPCGDFNWMSQMNPDLDSYVGADIVQKIIDENNEKHASPKRQFVHLDLLRDALPKGDAILCRDCLVHFGDAEVRKALSNFKRSGSTYLITTTYPDRGPSQNIILGEWQPLNLQAAPFNLPAPLRLLDEKRLEKDGSNTGKCLGVWRLSDVVIS